MQAAKIIFPPCNPVYKFCSDHSLSNPGIGKSHASSNRNRFPVAQRWFHLFGARTIGGRWAILIWQIVTIGTAEHR